MILEDLDTLSKGFFKLGEKYTQSTVRISALEGQLNACQSESEQLRVRVATLQEELRVQTDTMANEVATLTSTLRVRIDVLEHSSQQIYPSVD